MRFVQKFNLMQVVERFSVDGMVQDNKLIISV
jgi:hypothetical protein